MSDADTRFHEAWLGMVQPAEGLVVAVPVLVDAQVGTRHKPEFHKEFLELLEPIAEDDGEPDGNDGGGGDARGARLHTGLTPPDRFIAGISTDEVRISRLIPWPRGRIHSMWAKFLDRRLEP